MLLLAPLPIVGASWLVSNWARSEPAAEIDRNDVVPPSVELGDEFRVESPVVQVVHEEPAPRNLADDCDAAARAIQRDLGPEFPVIVRPPFVLAGDLSDEELAGW